MSKLLRLKHWQLFLLLTGAPLVFQLFAMQAMIRNDDPQEVFVPFAITMIIVVTIFFGWFYALGTNLHKQLPESVSMNLARFKLFLLIPAFYLLSFCLLILFAISDQELFQNYFTSFSGIIIPIHLLSTFSIFYALYFVSKALKSVEWQRPVTFSDYAGEFFLIWFFPLGVWIIQPRINRLFYEEKDFIL